MMQAYKCKASDVLTLDDDYVKFCIDEAFAIILIKLENGEKIIDKEKESPSNSLSSFYNRIIDIE